MSNPLEQILDPTGGSDVTVDTTLSARPVTPNGKVMGLLGNGKPNGSVLLSEIGHHLESTYRLRGVREYAKSYFGTPVEQTQTEKIIAECDFVVTAIGD